MVLEGYSRPAYNKLVLSATTRSTVVGVIHKLTVDEFVDHTNTLMTCCGEIFEVQNVEMSRVTLTTTLSGRIFQQAGTCYGQHRPTLNLKSLQGHRQ